MFEAIEAGCIPVLLADRIVLPFAELVDWTTLVVRVAEADVHSLLDILQAITPARIAAMRAALADARPALLFGWPPEPCDAFELTLMGLEALVPPVRRLGASRTDADAPPRAAMIEASAAMEAAAIEAAGAIEAAATTEAAAPMDAAAALERAHHIAAGREDGLTGRRQAVSHLDLGPAYQQPEWGAGAKAGGKSSAGSRSQRLTPSGRQGAARGTAETRASSTSSTASSITATIRSSSTTAPAPGTARTTSTTSTAPNLPLGVIKPGTNGSGGDSPVKSIDSIEGRTSRGDSARQRVELIVLYGSSCVGKSTAASALRHYLQQHGFRALASLEADHLIPGRLYAPQRAKRGLESALATALVELRAEVGEEAVRRGTFSLDEPADARASSELMAQLQLLALRHALPALWRAAQVAGAKAGCARAARTKASGGDALGLLVGGGAPGDGGGGRAQGVDGGAEGVSSTGQLGVSVGSTGREADGSAGQEVGVAGSMNGRVRWASRRVGWETASMPSEDAGGCVAVVIATCSFLPLPEHGALLRLGGAAVAEGRAAQGERGGNGEGKGGELRGRFDASGGSGGSSTSSTSSDNSDRSTSNITSSAAAERKRAPYGWLQRTLLADSGLELSFSALGLALPPSTHGRALAAARPFFKTSVREAFVELQRSYEREYAPRGVELVLRRPDSELAVDASEWRGSDGVVGDGATQVKYGRDSASREIELAALRRAPSASKWRRGSTGGFGDAAGPSHPFGRLLERLEFRGRSLEVRGGSV
jgi:hypothetical protein